ncbi:hypothetical protein AAHA92_01333 [Salvia divinorum]|uniref:Uncharacterized protein n=1 Tax=Salvia divinorum TaxID=28513 RepID=A0ABD1IQN0_SALDI
MFRVKDDQSLHLGALAGDPGCLPLDYESSENILCTKALIPSLGRLEFWPGVTGVARTKASTLSAPKDVVIRPRRWKTS